MSESERVPLVMKIFFPLFMMLLTLAAAYLFFSELVSNLRDMSSLPESVSFSKGSYYACGAGFAVGVFTFFSVSEFWFSVVIKGRLAKRLMRIAVGGAIVMVVFPQVMHFYMGRFIEENTYIVCEEASSQWLHAKTIVYVKDVGVCQEMAASFGATE